jgi:hypothetical protein
MPENKETTGKDKDAKSAGVPFTCGEDYVIVPEVVPPSADNPFPIFPLRATVDSILGGPRRFVRANRPRDRLYASELGNCQRAVWRNWRFPRPHDEKFERGRGALGHAVEEMLASEFSPVLVAREVSFTNQRVSGRADFFIRLPPSDEFPQGVQVPVELKSTYALDMAVKDPKRAHVLQLRYYMEASDAPFGFLIYINLGNWGGRSGEYVALKVDRNDHMLESFVNKLWRVVHRDAEPRCENEDDPKGCFDCSVAAKDPADPEEQVV